MLDQSFILLDLGRQQLIFYNILLEDILGKIIGAGFCGRHTGICT